jgi:hypothetical protein
MDHARWGHKLFRWLERKSKEMRPSGGKGDLQVLTILLWINGSVSTGLRTHSIKHSLLEADCAVKKVLRDRQ